MPSLKFSLRDHRRMIWIFGALLLIIIPATVLACYWAIAPTHTRGTARTAAQTPPRFRQLLAQLEPSGPLFWTYWWVPTRKQERIIISGNISPEHFQAFVAHYSMAVSSITTLPDRSDTEEAAGNSDILMNFGPSTECYMGRVDNLYVRRLFYDRATNHFVIEIKTIDSERT